MNHWARIHLAYSPDLLKQGNSFPKDFLSLPKIMNFSNEKIFHTHLKEPIVHSKKKFLILTWKINHFFKRENVFYLSEKKQNFETKHFLWLTQKIICYTCGKKLKYFILEVFWILFCYFLNCKIEQSFQQTNKNANQKHQPIYIFEAVLFFHTFPYDIFLYSASHCFSC